MRLWILGVLLTGHTAPWATVLSDEELTAPNLQLASEDETLDLPEEQFVLLPYDSKLDLPRRREESEEPTPSPSSIPTANPTDEPTTTPTTYPTEVPTDDAPTDSPTASPTTN